MIGNRYWLETMRSKEIGDMNKMVTKIVGFVVMLLCSAGVIVAAAATKDNSNKLFEGDAVDIGGLDAETYQVTALEQSKDGNYIVHAVGVGYNESANIELAVVFDPAGENVLKMKVVEQSETKGLGSKIADDEFVSQFDGIAAPVTVGGLLPKNPKAPEEDTGLTATGFDSVTAATISSKGVAKIINNAYFFLHDQVIQ